jgi:Trp operon repressor
VETERHHLSLVLLSHTLEAVVAAVQLLLVQVVLEVEEMAQPLLPVLLGVLELRTLVEVVEAVEATLPQIEMAAQVVQVSSSLNTSPNLITKSSNHQAHGLHLVALLRSST